VTEEADADTESFSEIVSSPRPVESAAQHAAPVVPVARGGDGGPAVGSLGENFARAFALAVADSLRNDGSVALPKLGTLIAERKESEVLVSGDGNVTLSPPSMTVRLESE